jgi:hypothetical protein
VRIDHVVLGSRDLEETATRYERDHGLASVPGGSHPAWGTANRIVPLGDDYVEFLAVVDPDVAGKSRFGTFLRDLTAGSDRWFTVCLADDDLDGTARRLGLEVVRGSRVRPDGTELTWRSAGLEDPERDPWLPFFIEWQFAGAHPGRMPVAPAPTATGIAWVEIVGDEERLRAWVGDEDLPIRVVGGAEHGLRAVGLASPTGEIVLA